jgi:NAD-dependent dihydropyrimidine dehydrogenase PreA subunit
MFNVVTDACTKDMVCVMGCPTSAISPNHFDSDAGIATQVFIDPDACIGCGRCVSACPHNAIFAMDELPDGQGHFAAANQKYFN